MATAWDGMGCGGMVPCSRCCFYGALFSMCFFCASHFYFVCVCLFFCLIGFFSQEAEHSKRFTDGVSDFVSKVGFIFPSLVFRK